MSDVMPLEEYYQIKYADEEAFNVYIFSTYYKNVIEKDDYLSKTFLQIERHMKRAIKGKNRSLYYKNNPITRNNFFTLPIIDRLGNMRNVNVIKNLMQFSDIYEIRMNTEYEKFRILIFPYDSMTNTNTLALVFTYGFIKAMDQIDLTDVLAQSSQNISDGLYTQIISTEILGEFLP